MQDIALCLKLSVLEGSVAVEHEGTTHLVLYTSVYEPRLPLEMPLHQQAKLRGEENNALLADDCLSLGVEDSEHPFEYV